MAALTGRTIRASYIELLKLNTASTNTGVTGSLIDVTDGGNTASALSLSTSQIASSVDGSAGTAAFTRKGDTNTGVFFPAADTIAVTTTGTERMRIDSSGNVGIGTTAPATKLTVSGSSGTGSELRVVSTTANTGGKITLYEDISACWEINAPTGANGPFTLKDIFNNAERLRITSTGNVGIGTASPTAPLHVSGSGTTVVKINGGTSASQGPSLKFQKDSTDALILGVASAILGGGSTSNDSMIYTEGTNNLLFYNNAAERMRVTSTGLVGIGMTPTAQLELSTDSAKKPSTNTWTITSDERLKTSIVDADKNRCYEIVKQVPLKRYTWKSEVYSQDQVKDRSKLGWIAQDVEAVFPKAVGTNRFAYNQVFEDVIVPELDSEGNAVFEDVVVPELDSEGNAVFEDVVVPELDSDGNAVFEDVVVPELDSDGNAVFNEDGVAKTRIEKSNVAKTRIEKSNVAKTKTEKSGVAKTKTEKRLVSEEVIEDCKDLNADQMYAAMYGTIQKLIEKVETLEAKVLSLQAA